MVTLSETLCIPAISATRRFDDRVDDICIDIPHEMLGVFKTLTFTPGARQASTKQKDGRICRGSVPVDLVRSIQPRIRAYAHICLLNRMLSCHYCILCVPRTVHRISNSRPLASIPRKDTTLFFYFLLCRFSAMFW